MAREGKAAFPRPPQFPRAIASLAEKVRTSPGDLVFRAVVVGLAIGTLLLMLWMVYQLYDNARDTIEAFGVRFIINREWNPVKAQFGALTFIFGTVVTALIALAIAGPIGLGAAIFLAEYAPAYVR